MSDPLDDFADDLVRQSKELWSHVPNDEPDDDANLQIKTDEEGLLIVKTQDGTVFFFHGDHVCRARALPEGDELSTWRRGRMTYCGVVPRKRERAVWN
jgi:hypothetical protein